MFCDCWLIKHYFIRNLLVCFYCIVLLNLICWGPASVSPSKRKLNLDLMHFRGLSQCVRSVLVLVQYCLLLHQLVCDLSRDSLIIKCCTTGWMAGILFSSGAGICLSASRPDQLWGPPNRLGSEQGRGQPCIQPPSQATGPWRWPLTFMAHE